MVVFSRKGRSSGGESRKVSVEFFLLFSTILFLSIAWIRVQNIRLARELRIALLEEKKIQRQNNRLRLELDQLISPKRLQDIGERKFGLRKPRPQQVKRISLY